MSKTIVSNTIIDSLKMRRSRYDLSKKTTLNEQQLQAILEGALLHTPTAYNSQSGRLILLLKEQHDALWDIVLAALKPLVGPKEWAKTEAKVNAFKQAYGTILFFEEEAIVKQLQEQFPLYKENFALWSMQSAGMLNLVVWTALAEAGMGASLQHYNPLIDEAVKAKFNLPATWRLIAQMPFGVPTSDPDEKEFDPINERYRILK
jgi:hypothetical protein